MYSRNKISHYIPNDIILAENSVAFGAIRVFPLHVSRPPQLSSAGKIVAYKKGINKQTNAI